MRQAVKFWVSLLASLRKPNISNFFVAMYVWKNPSALTMLTLLSCCIFGHVIISRACGGGSLKVSNTSCTSDQFLFLWYTCRSSLYFPLVSFLVVYRGHHGI